MCRARRLCLALLALLLMAGPAMAHQKTVSVLDATLHPTRVDFDLQLPVDALNRLVGHPLPTWVGGTLGSDSPRISAYMQRHMRVSTLDGTRWALQAQPGRVINTQTGLPDIALRVVGRPPPGRPVAPFILDYDALMDVVPGHRTFLTVINDRGIAGVPAGRTLVGTLTQDNPQAIIGGDAPTWWADFLDVMGLGIEHIAAGSDHLLFLMMLLLTAPLIAVAGHRWHIARSPRRAAWRVTKIATAFTLGHSLTLILITLGLFTVPTRPVEVLIAVSVAVSALHAMRPLIRNGEVWIAAGFGLIHGMAFATLLSDVTEETGTLVGNLIAFNIGIEVCQLLVIALTMPSLWILSRTRAYTPFRWSAAAFGFTVACAWAVARAIGADSPFDFATEQIPAHPFWVIGGIAVLAACAWAATRRGWMAPVPTDD